MVQNLFEIFCIFASVSYTHLADIIKQQDQHIQEYLKKQGWTLSAKYCDRKKDTEENTAFEELTKDGIDRKFDMVVVDSIDRCSRTCLLYTSREELSEVVNFVATTHPMGQKRCRRGDACRMVSCLCY